MGSSEYGEYGADPVVETNGFSALIDALRAGGRVFETAAIRVHEEVAVMPDGQTTMRRVEDEYNTEILRGLQFEGVRRRGRFLLRHTVECALDEVKPGDRLILTHAQNETITPKVFRPRDGDYYGLPDELLREEPRG
jgi:hypothetical protein